MSKPPLPEAVVAMLRKSQPGGHHDPARDGQPVYTATWYLGDDGRVLVNMDQGRKRLEHMRSDPRVALDVLDEATGTPTSASPATSRRCARTRT